MQDKEYFVVGGSSGIGLEIVRSLVDKGARVYVGSRTPGHVSDLASARHIRLDVTSEQFDLDALPKVLNGLVYCPGTINLKPFQRLKAEDFSKDLQVNYLGAVKVIQAILPRLKKSKPTAAVVLFSTVAAATGMPYHASIAGSKGAVEGLTRSLAAEFAPRIQFNAIAPSLTDTPLATPLLSNDQKRQASADRHPLKRIGNAQEIAALAVHLLSNAGTWITGQVISVDGGMGTVKTFR